MVAVLLVIILFIVLGSCSVYRSYGDFFVADGLIRRAKSISDNLVLSHVTTTFLFVLSLSFIERIILSVFTFPP